MKRILQAIILVLVASSAIAYAEPVAKVEHITLSDQGDIKRADELSNAIDEVSKKVMACNKEAVGSVEACDCSALDTCKFKSEYKNAATLYCKIKVDYPSWTGKIVDFYFGQTSDTHSLYMEGLEQQFGQFCKG